VRGSAQWALCRTHRLRCSTKPHPLMCRRAGDAADAAESVAPAVSEPARGLPDRCRSLLTCSSVSSEKGQYRRFARTHAGQRRTPGGGPWIQCSSQGRPSTFTEEVRAVRLLRESLGRDQIRFDPNAACRLRRHSIGRHLPTPRSSFSRPTWNIEACLWPAGCAHSFATNMWVVN